MEEIEISSWLTLDAIKKSAEVVETVGSLQTGHSISVFCEVDEDFLELTYSDSAANFLRRYDDRNEFETALEQRKEDVGDAPYEESRDLEKDYEGEGEEEGGDGFHIEEELEDY